MLLCAAIASLALYQSALMLGAESLSHESTLSTCEVIPEDQFNFLGENYPDLLPQFQNPFSQDNGYSHAHNVDYYGEDKVINYIKVGLNLKVSSPAWFKDEHITNPTYRVIDAIASALANIDGEKEQLTKFAKNHPREGFYKVFFEEKAKEGLTLQEDTLLAAEYLYQAIADYKDQDAVVLFLGRTPCYLQLAYEEVLKATGAENQRAVHLSFSGNPDALPKVKEGTPDKKSSYTRNVVTSERLSHYFNYMDSKHILGASKIYIVDMASSGRGLNSFLNILHLYYKRSGKIFPALNFMSMYQKVYSEGGWRLFDLKPKGQENGKNLWELSFPENTDVNIHPFQVDTHIILMSRSALRFHLDDAYIQDFAVHGVEYPAEKWIPEHDAERHAGGPLAQEMSTYLRDVFSKMVQKHLTRLLQQ